ncbi:lantibiotic immunity ABC transporter MutG family permease subunit [Thermovenabulum gondwanense]|uniref:ABC-2 type transporter domain-containing protein n=1 Tax=Thermovenabulum gondwanense TaxID=520767 RepID=A0A162MYZ9_9FIRM|nr:lantibiotic immunity ABC transporter MutG family permease subunit [Thermovenabulum gondwanense]KYO68576.1 hypothetical protein ATZ99_00850 [Thermovenabulum gondwanense]
MGRVSFLNLLSAEWLKTKRTPVRWLSFLTPVAFSVLLTWYFSLKKVTPYIQAEIYQAFFEVWAAVVIPAKAGIISGIMVNQEELAGDFNGFLGSKLPRNRLYLGKLATITLFSMTSIMIGMVTLLIGIRYVLNIHVNGIIFIMAAFILQLSAMPLFAFHIWIGFARGMGVSCGLGGAGVLIASLMASSLGDTVWPLVPWAWPMRLSMLPGIYLPGVILPPHFKSLRFILEQSLKGIIPVAVFFTIMLVGGLVWFNKWECEKTYD